MNLEFWSPLSVMLPSGMSTMLALSSHLRKTELTVDLRRGEFLASRLFGW